MSAESRLRLVTLFINVYKRLIDFMLCEWMTKCENYTFPTRLNYRHFTQSVSASIYACGIYFFKLHNREYLTDV